eukprot:2765325-Pleurochrysis_carterae.AAC.1
MFWIKGAVTTNESSGIRWLISKVKYAFKGDSPSEKNQHIRHARSWCELTQKIGIKILGRQVLRDVHSARIGHIQRKPAAFGSLMAAMENLPG